MIFKRIAGICFAIAFIMAIVLFGGYGWQYISPSTAKTIFLISGALGLLLNLLSFQLGKHNILFNFTYWTGSIVLFIGLTFHLMHFPYWFHILIAGIIILGISFVLPSSLSEKKEKDHNLLDDELNK